MPFKDTCRMEERIGLLRDYDSGVFTIKELCVRYGVHRDTFYFWKARRESVGDRWWEVRSHATAHCPHATREAVAAQIVAVRRRFPHFGPKKIKAWLEREKPREPWPAASTIGDILKRAGLVEARSKRRPAVAQGEIVAPATEPNQEWSIDFKGWFRTANGERCDPLTLCDAASRYVVGIAIVEPTWAGVRGALERIVEDLGLPDAIRSDNVLRQELRGSERQQISLH